jgi:peptide/nickel transport system substrate-binding protein
VDYDDVYEAASEMQRIWVYECPYIICYENIQMIAYRNDRFEGHSQDVLAGASSFWTNQKIRLKASEGGPWGGTFRWSNGLDVDSFNFMVTTSGYSSNVLNELYDSLIVIDPDGNDMMWLAESYIGETHTDNPDVPEGFTRFTFDIIQNATWTDGHPLTAEDIAFSLNYFRDAPGNQYGSDLTDMTAAYAPTTYSLVVEFGSESFWHLHNVAYKPVIPKHIFLDIGLDGWNTWSPRPPQEEMVTSGPFNVSDYVEGEFIEISRNPNFFWNLEDYRVTETPTGPTGGGTDFTLAIIAGAVAAAVVILVGGYVLIRQR